MTATRERRTETPVSTRGVVSGLARFEAVRMLRHPLTWLGLAGSVYAMWALLWGRAPLLERDSIVLAGTMLPVAASTLLVAFSSTLRQRRLPELLLAKPADRNARLIGVQLGTIGPAVAASVVMSIGIVYLLTGDPIGELLWSELLAGIMMIPAVGVLGSVLARWMPHPIVAPVALVGLGVMQVWASPGFEVFRGFPWSDWLDASVEWLAPWMVLDGFSPLSRISDRPALLHLLYLVGFAFVVAYLARERRQPGLIVKMAVTGGFLAALGAISVGIADEADGFVWPEAAETQICDAEDGVEFCAFRYYEGWIPRWQTTVAAVNELAPVDLDRVVQRPHNIGWDDDSGLNDRTGLALTTLEWDRPGTTAEQQFSLALMAAQTSVDLPATAQLRPMTEAEIDEIMEQNPEMSEDFREELAHEETEHECSGVGQARTAAAVWIAGASTPGGPALIDWLLAQPRGSDTFSLAYIDPHHDNGVTIGRPDAIVARQLLDISQTEVHDMLMDHWNEVLDPATTTADLASWFGLSAPDQAELDFFQLPCP